MFNPLFYLLGDSHVTPFRWFYPFPLCHIGPATAWGLMNLNSWTHSQERVLGIVSGINKERDFVITSFGEIDCRYRIYERHLRKGMSISEVVDKTIERYGQFLELVEDRQVAVMVLGVPPASREGNDIPLPDYGDLKTRVGIHREFSRKLADHCKKTGLVYIELLSKTCDDEGVIKQDWTSDGEHLTNRVVPLVTTIINEELGLDLKCVEGNTDTNVLNADNFREYRAVQTVLASLARYWMTGQR